MTALTVSRDAATLVGLQRLDSIVSGTGDAPYLLTVLNDVLEDLVRAHPWQALAKQGTLTIEAGEFSDDFDSGDFNTQGELEMPDDFAFWRSEAQFWISDRLSPMRQISSQDEWIGIGLQGWFGTVPCWTYFGNKIYIKPAPTATTRITFIYQSKNAVRAEDDTLRVSVEADSDRFLIPQRLIKLGMIWRYRELKGLPYAEDLGQYQTALSQEIMRDAGPGLMVIGRRRVSSDAAFAWPFPIIP